jgi:L-alanine-DL-glutamate epimerase-like enolase superfamily enzyme
MSVPDRVVSHAGLGGLTIRSIETIPVRVPLARTYSGSHYRMTHRSTIVTRVHTEEGIVGEAYSGDEDAGLGEIDGIIHGEIAPRLVGEDAFAVERIWQLARPATFDILRDRRLGLVATACVDTAIWDAVGKACGQPLWRIWGGFRRRLQVISIGGYYGTGVSIDEEIADFRERGLAGMKFKVGGLSPEEDALRVHEARAAAGDDFILCVDANQAWTPQEAIRFAHLVRNCSLRWFEEPCRWSNDRRAMRDVRFAGGVPICAGQTEFSAGGCRDLMVDAAIDICNFDASWSGGPTEWRRVAGMALVFDCEMGHHEEPQVAAHLLASIPNGTFLEVFHPDRDPIWWHMISNRPEVRDGWVELRDEPGLGWELDWDFVERHRVDFERSG